MKLVTKPVGATTYMAKKRVTHEIKWYDVIIGLLLGAFFVALIAWISIYQIIHTLWSFEPRKVKTMTITRVMGWTILFGLCVLLLFGCSYDAPKADSAALEVKSRGSRGTGFVIDAQHGLVLTAGHVISPAGEYWAKSETGRVTPLEILWQAKKYDVALLQLKGDYNYAEFDISCTDPKIGDDVKAIGYPLAFGRLETWGKVAANNVREFLQWTQLFVVNVSGGPGSSGGPVLNEYGQVTGMIVAGSDRQGGDMIFAVPGSTMCKLLARV